MADQVPRSDSDTSPATLEDLTSARSAGSKWLVDLVAAEVGGGRLSPMELHAIADHPHATALRVSGLDQLTFETLVSRYGQQFSALQFWKCPRIEDFGPLESLTGLTHVSIFWNQRTSRLWDLRKTPRLRGLEFADFSRLRDLDFLAGAVSIEELSFGDKVWVKAAVESLEPLRELGSLQRLSFAVRKVEDARIQPLAALHRLEKLEVPWNLFTTEQLAWLRARLPVTVQGRVLAPIEKLDRSLPNPNGHGPDLDVIVMGKRKPFLSSQVDAAKIGRYVDRYWQLVERFRSNPSLDP